MQGDHLFDARWRAPPRSEPVKRADLPRHGGVYALLDEQDRLVQLLATQCLRRSIAHRLREREAADKSARANLREICASVLWKKTTSPFETMLAYYEIARVLMPDSYRRQVAFGPVWFAGLDLREPFPRWTPRKTAFETPEPEIGPFADRRSCVSFIQTVEELFDLCREYAILVQAPHGAACAYKDMGKCPAPCDGSIDMSHYRRMLSASRRFAEGELDQRFAEMEEDMRRAAAKLDFETAARTKQKLDRAKQDLSGCRRLTPTVNDFRYLAVQSGGGKAVKPFFVDRGCIRTGKRCLLQDLESAVPTWLTEIDNPSPGEPESPVLRSERIALVSYYLGKKGSRSGLFWRRADLPSAAEMVESIREKFGVSAGRRHQERPETARLLERKGQGGRV